MFVITLLLTDFFDTMVTMVAVGQEGGLVTQDGSVPRAHEILLVGFLMMLGIRTIDWTDYEIAIPAFLTIVLMPFTYSISKVIGAGVISFALIKLVRGKAREVHPLLWGVAALFLLYFLHGVTEIMFV